MTRLPLFIHRDAASVPPRYACVDREERCNRPGCRLFVAPVAGDWRRRFPVCARVLGDVAAMYGGFSLRAVGWHMGIDRREVWHIERRAIAKMRVGLDADRRAS